MRQKIYSLFLTALLGLSGMNAWAQLSTTTIDGTEYYEISSADDLATFASMVNGSEFTANAILTDDIDMSELDSWTPIGIDNDHGYKGTFDGQGKTITGFQLTSSTSNNSYGVGFFGHIADGANIQNFSIYGTITSTGQRMSVIGSAQGNVNISGIHSHLNITCTQTRHGGILGAQVGTGTINIDRCSFSGSLTTDNISGNFGGIVGLTLNNSSAYINITNCLFDGTIDIGTGDNAGGFVGYTRQCQLKIENCLSVGTITAANPGQFIGQITNTSNQKYSGVNYYLGDNKTQGTGNATEAGPTPVKVTTEQLASGEVCYLLNGDQSDINWYQTLIDEDYPTPNGTDIVYLAGRSHCDGTAYEGVTGYSNTASQQDEHDFADGLCTYCGTVDETYMTANADGFFEIGTATQLVWFAAYVNQVNTAANGLLTADIDMTGIEWTPIGIGSGNVAPGATAYTGTFDGQGHAITGFSAEGTGHLGLFGDTKGATVKNFSLSGSLTVTGGYGGGGVAWPINTTIENVHSALIVSVPNSGTHHVGGVVGSARGNNTINKCTFSGSMTVAAGSTDNFAGIAAYITGGDKVTNCANSGNVTFKDQGCAAGGVVGYLNSTTATIQNCLTTGTILYDGDGTPKYGAAILGRTKGFSSSLVTNNYWLEGSAYGAAKYDNGTDPISAGSVTADQLASGEVAVNLGLAWHQVLGTDDYPTLDATKPFVAQITAAGYATLYITEADVTVPAGVKAYTAELATKDNYQYLALKEIATGVIPAETAVILKGTEGFYQFAVSTEETIPDGALRVYEDEVDGNEALVKGLAAPIEGNVLKGTAVDIDAAGKYVLANVDGTVCFCQAGSGKIKAGKAYLELTSDVKAFYFLFPEDDATAIQTIENGQQTTDGAIYNVAGQRMSKMQKGINIVAGKKVLY